MNNFRAEPAQLLSAQAAAVEKVMRSGWYVLGAEVQNFEQQWAIYCGARHAVGVGNGMDAIELALRALKIGPGDEVITTPMTAAATVMAIMRTGARPVLADIDSETALLSRQSVEQCLTPQTRAVLLVHLYGQLRNMESWLYFCAANKLHLVEDCAQAHGAKWIEKKAGSFGSCGAFSFYPTKNLGAHGDGGAVVTDSPAIADAIRTLRNYGQEKRYQHTQFGLNSRLDELQAAILSARLPWLEQWNARRREIAGLYFRGISHPQVQLLAPPVHAENHVFHLFVVRCENRDSLAAHLKANEIQADVHYPVPLHRQAFALSNISVPLPLPGAEKHAATCLSLPCHPYLTDDDVARVINGVNSWRPT